MLELGIAAATAIAIGLSTVLLLWPGIGGPATLAVKIFLGIGIGQGITACLAFIFLLVHGRPDASYAFYEMLVLLLLLVLLVRRRGRRIPPSTVHGSVNAAPSYSRYEWILAGALFVAAAAALGSILISMYRVPYGQWDAWAIYNLRARSIYRGGADWRDAFSWFLYRSHPDYPPLLPLAVVRTWMYTRTETMLAPALIGGLFTAATIGIVASVVAMLRGRSQAWIAGIVLLGNVFLIQHTSSQYADVPLMFFYAACVALLALDERGRDEKRSSVLMLAGLAAGLAAFTKNEGLLFVAVVLVAHFLVVFRGTDWRQYGRELRSLAIGLLPVMLIFLYFKFKLAPPSDLVAMTAGQSLLGKLMDPSRYLLIASEVTKRIVLHESIGLGMALPLVLYAACAGLGGNRSRGTAVAALTLVLLFLGYIGVYIVTPYPLAWHLFTSIDRILLQMWPIFVFVFFLIVATPAKMLGSTALDTRPERTVTR